MQLSVTMRPAVEGRHLLLAAGEVDIRSYGLLREALGRVLAAEPVTEVIVDLSAVTFCDCVGIGVLIAARMAAAEHNVVLRVVNPQRHIHRILRLSGVLEFLLGRDPVAT